MGDIERVLARLREMDAMPPFLDASLRLPVIVKTTLLPPVNWRRFDIAEACACRLPQDLETFWTASGGARIYEDVSSGQWGMVIWSPADVIKHSPQEVASWNEYRAGDLVVGQFRGDDERVVVRSDPNLPDFGSVVIVPELDERSDWITAAPSFGTFLWNYIDAQGNKYWEPS
jgi:hypothetical protein